MRAIGVVQILVLVGLLAGVAAGRPDGVPGEVRLAGVADVKALCGELKLGSEEAAAGVYVVALPSTSLSFKAYEKKRARLALDLSRGLRAPTGAWELMPVAREGGLEVAVPATAKEAARLIKEAKAAELQLWLWFRPARLSGQEFYCAAVHGGGEESLRLGVEPLAFALVRGDETVATGETEAFAALRGEDGPVTDPDVRVGPAVLTAENRPAPSAITSAAQALGPSLLGCYKKGLAVEPELRGAIVVGVVVKDGKAAEARAELDSLGAPEVLACTLARVKGVKFPVKGVARFSFPVRFDQAE